MVDFHFLMAYGLLAISLLLYRYVEDYIGGADILIFLLLYSRYGFLFLNQIMFLSAIFGIIYGAIKKKKEIRFIPFILMAFIVVMFF